MDIKTIELLESIRDELTEGMSPRDAEAMGQKAFKRGLKAVPIHDKDFMAKLKPMMGKPGSTSKYFEAWSKGFMSAQRKAANAELKKKGFDGLPSMREGLDEDLLEAMSPADRNTITTIERAVEDSEMHLAQIKSSIKKYVSNPEKYKPQLKNIMDAAKGLKGTQMRIVKMLGNLK